MKKIFVSLIFILLMISYILCFPNVRATSYNYYENFEGGIATTQLTVIQSKSGFLSSKSVHAGATYISTVSKHTGIYGYQATGTAYGDTCVYFNFTGNSNYLTNFSLWQKSDSIVMKTWYFINKSSGLDLIRIQTGGGKLYYLDDTSTWIEYSSYLDASWKEFGFFITDNTGICNYFVTGDLINSGIAHYPASINSGLRIDTIKWFYPTETINYIDDFNFTMSHSYENTSTNNGCEGITTFQTYDTGSYSSLPIGSGYGQFVESQYLDFSGLGITGNLTNVSLSVSSDQYNQISSDLNKYTLVVNGLFLGYADNWGYDGSEYWLNWDNLNIPLINNYPIFSFGCLQFKNLGQKYYWYGLGMNLESERGYKYHNSSILHLNGIYDGTHQNYNLIYRFNISCYELGEAGSIDTPEDFVNTAIYFDFYDQHTGTKLNVWDWSIISGSPSWLKNHCKLKFSLTAISTGGNYTKIYPSNAGVTLSNTFVTFQNVLIAPYSNNKIDFFGESSGNIAGSIDGVPVIWNRVNQIMILKPLGHYRVDLVRNNEIGTLPIDNDTIDWWENYTGTNFFIEFSDQEICGYRVNDATNNVPALIYELNNSKFSGMNGYIWEIQNGRNETLKTGTIYFIGTEASGYVVTFYTFKEAGEYHVSLYNITSSNTKDKLVYRSFNINVCPEEIVPNPIENIFGFDIPPWLKLVFGIVIILFITISPMLISFLLSSKGHIDINIPALVYVAFFFLGTCVSVALGLISIIIPFIVLLGLVLAFAVMWQRGSISGG